MTLVFIRIVANLYSVSTGFNVFICKLIRIPNSNQSAFPVLAAGKGVNGASLTAVSSRGGKGKFIS